MRSVRAVRAVAMLAALAPPAMAIAGESHLVTVADFSFTPAELTIAVGDSVTWQNQGGLHNVRADDDAFRCANGCDAETPGAGNPSSAGWSFTLVFHEGADVPYYCEIHGAPGGSGMAATLTVEGIFGDGFESGDTDVWDTAVGTGALRLPSAADPAR